MQKKPDNINNFNNYKRNYPEYLTNNENNEDHSKPKSFARNIRGRLGFASETPEELEEKRKERENYYKDIQLQIEEKQRKKEDEKNKRLLDDINEEKRIKNQLKEEGKLN